MPPFEGEMFGTVDGRSTGRSPYSSLEVARRNLAVDPRQGGPEFQNEVALRDLHALWERMGRPDERGYYNLDRKHQDMLMKAAERVYRTRTRAEDVTASDKWEVLARVLRAREEETHPIQSLMRSAVIPQPGEMVLPSVGGAAGGVAKVGKATPNVGTLGRLAMSKVEGGMDDAFKFALNHIRGASKQAAALVGEIEAAIKGGMDPAEALKQVKNLKNLKADHQKLLQNALKYTSGQADEAVTAAPKVEQAAAGTAGKVVQAADNVTPPPAAAQGAGQAAGEVAEETAEQAAKPGVVDRGRNVVRAIQGKPPVAPTTTGQAAAQGAKEGAKEAGKKWTKGRVIRYGIGTVGFPSLAIMAGNWVKETVTDPLRSRGQWKWAGVDPEFEKRTPEERAQMAKDLETSGVPKDRIQGKIASLRTRDQWEEETAKNDKALRDIWAQNKLDEIAAEKNKRDIEVKARLEAPEAALGYMQELNALDQQRLQNQAAIRQKYFQTAIAPSVAMRERLWARMTGAE